MPETRHSIDDLRRWLPRPEKQVVFRAADVDWVLKSELGPLKSISRVFQPDCAFQLLGGRGPQHKCTGALLCVVAFDPVGL